MKITIFSALFLLFFLIVFIGRIGCQNADNERFEKKCLKDQVNDTFYFVDFLDPLFFLCLPLPFMIYYYLGVKALLVLCAVFSSGQMSVWIIAMLRYSNRPKELQKRKWQTRYLCWIIGHFLSFITEVSLFGVYFQ